MGQEFQIEQMPDGEKQGSYTSADARQFAVGGQLPSQSPFVPSLEYRRPGAELPPSQSYFGIFLMLRITAWFFVICLVLPALIGFYGVLAGIPALRFTSPPIAPQTSNAANLASIIIPAGMLLLALLYGAGNVIGFTSRTGRALFLTAAVSTLVLHAVTFVAQIIFVQTPEYQDRHGGRLFQTILPRLASTELMSATFALLCIVAMISAGRRQRSPGRRSPWLPLAKTIAVIGLVWGLLHLWQFAWFAQSLATNPRMRIWLRSSPLPLTLESGTLLSNLLYVAGGLTILLNRGFGRFLILVAVAWNLCWIPRALANISQRRDMAFDRQVLYANCGALVVFAILAAIILLQRRLFAPAGRRLSPGF